MNKFLTKKETVDLISNISKANTSLELSRLIDGMVETHSYNSFKLSILLRKKEKLNEQFDFIRKFLPFIYMVLVIELFSFVFHITGSSNLTNNLFTQFMVIVASVSVDVAAFSNLMNQNLNTKKIIKIIDDDIIVFNMILYATYKQDSLNTYPSGEK